MVLAFKMSLAARPIVIFDFDGTLADSLQLVIQEYNRLAPRYRVKRVDVAELPRLRAMKPSAILREHNITFWKLPIMVSHMRLVMHGHADALQPFAGIAEVLRGLASAGVRCNVLSTNSSKNIGRFLRRHGLEVFDQIEGSVSMSGKARALRKLIERQGWPANQIVYVGDEIRDIEAAHAAGVRALAVSWGYADPKALQAHRPWQTAEHPGQLLSLLVPG
ncbi:MAG TPA: HAD hydrolase-like protein [Polyangiales bacterium]